VKVFFLPSDERKRWVLSVPIELLRRDESHCQAVRAQQRALHRKPHYHPPDFDLTPRAATQHVRENTMQKANANKTLNPKKKEKRTNKKKEARRNES
jgi:hypothetical protein